MVEDKIKLNSPTTTEKNGDEIMDSQDFYKIIVTFYFR